MSGIRIESDEGPGSAGRADREGRSGHGDRSGQDGRADREGRSGVDGPRTPWLNGRRALFAVLVGGTTIGGTALMLRIVGAGGLGVLEVALVVLFAGTFGWITVSFWTAVFGSVLHVLRRDPVTLEPLPAALAGDDAKDGSAGSAEGTDRAAAPSLRSRTALIMPAFNEDPEAVLSGLRAVVRSVAETGHGLRFDAFLLSDTMDPERAAEEESAWSLLRGEMAGTEFRNGAPGEAQGAEPVPDGPAGTTASSVRAFRPGACEFGRLVYRRRSENAGRKAGNVWDFCERWGEGYDFFVVLDADSLMSGETLVELVRAMEAHPRTGLIQTVPVLARQETLFGRILQFAATLQGPLLAAGQSFWQGDSANYWGHNAILRMDAFREHGRLPVLSGRPPLGGEILSHDFVEAALLRRRGWKVYLDATLGGSFEGLPGDIPSYAVRDRRWSQGSLQHLRLLAEPGLHPVSRLHFLFGAMGYVSSLLWLLMLLASTAYVFAVETGVGAGWATGVGGSGGGGAALGIFRGLPLLSLLAATAVLLLLPKVLAAALSAHRRADRFGGRLSLLASAALETLFSIALAPVMMLYHSRFVLSVLTGHDVPWSPRNRESADISWSSAWREGAWIMGVGLLWTAATLAVSVTFFLWLTPIFFGLVLAVPMIRWTGSTRLGEAARRWGVFRVSEEDVPGRSDDSGLRTASRDGRLELAERALFELRRGRPVRVRGSLDTLLAAVEGLEAETLQLLESAGDESPRLVVTHARARAMGVLPAGVREDGRREGRPGMDGTRMDGSQTDAARMDDAQGWSLGFTVDGTGGLGHLFELACAVRPAVGRVADARPASQAEHCALGAARIGRILPALVSVPTDGAIPGWILSVTVEDLRTLAGASGSEVHRIMEAPVPLEEAADARFIVFREVYGLEEHLAVVIGTPDRWPDPLPVRLHSACLTGDLFGSLRCDCGEQLRGSLRVFSERGGGVLLYLAQEGRGIGLINKLRAYSMQQDGLDTVDANRALGFDSDERRYDVAVAMLRDLGIDRIQLLTNNPEKVRAMEAGGIRVLDRMPLHGTLNRHNLPYVLAKHHRSGHWLESMLSSGLPPGDDERGEGS